MIKKVVHFLLLTYVILSALFFTTGALISFAVFIAGKLEDLTLYTPISTIIYGSIFFYCSHLLFTDKQRGYRFMLLFLPFLYIMTTLHRYFFISDQRFQYIDFNNLLLFGIPFVLALLLIEKRRLKKDYGSIHSNIY